jgi:hypothetical protein
LLLARGRGLLLVTQLAFHHHRFRSTLIYNVMVPSTSMDTFEKVGATFFPGYGRKPNGSDLIGMVHLRSPLGAFEIVGPLHTSFAGEWPIPVDVPASICGFRHSLGLSQVKFATLIRENRLNIERWEGGKSRPFRGDVLSLINVFRPHVDGQLAAGQLLNLVAAVVCPVMTRPGAIYTGHEIAAPLDDGRHHHRDLAPALLSAFVATEVLVPLDPGEEELDSRYVPLIGANIDGGGMEPWDSEVRALARRLNAEDRRLWLAMGHRLARP